MIQVRNDYKFDQCSSTDQQLDPEYAGGRISRISCWNVCGQEWL